jgi:hypothetical protein
MDKEKIKLVTDPTRVLFHVVTLKAEAEPVAEAAVTAEAALAEPEVIKKGKKEAEEGDDAAPAEKAEKTEKKPKEK